MSTCLALALLVAFAGYAAVSLINLWIERQR